MSSHYTTESGEKIPVKIWDTAGQERFKTITYSFYKQADGVIVTYDVTKQQTFKNIRTWLDSITEHADPKIIKVMVGNKVDLEHERKVTPEEAGELAKENDMSYFETSAKTGQNIQELMNYLMKEIYTTKFQSNDNPNRLQSVKIKRDSSAPGGGSP